MSALCDMGIVTHMTRREPAVWLAPVDRPRGTSRSGPRLASPDFLHDPAIAVWVAEGEERAIVAVLGIRPRHLFARVEMEDLASFYPALDERGARGLDVGDHQVQALDRARRRLGDPFPDADRARRARRCQLNDA